MTSKAIQCPSCSLLFPHAAFSDGSQCGRCANGKEDEPLCLSCGLTFPKLQGNTCGKCVHQSATSTHPNAATVVSRLETAFSTPINPRASTSMHPSHHRSSSRGQAFQAATATSEEILEARNCNYQDIVNSGFKGRRPPPAPISAQALATVLAQRCLFFSVVEMYINGVAQKDFESFSELYRGETWFQDVLKAIRVHVDSECSRLLTPPIHIYSRDQLSLRFLPSKLAPKRTAFDGTLQEFHDIHKQAGDGYFKTNKFRMIVRVTNNEAEHEPYVVPPTTHSSKTHLKRKASSEYKTIIQPRFKSRTISRETNTPPLEPHTSFQVYETSIIWEEEDEQTIVIAEKTSDKTTSIYLYDQFELGRGMTKVVHKLCQSIDGTFYTAKEYYQGETKGEAVDAVTNFKWLREELICTSFAAKVTEAFVEKTKEKNISIHDVTFLVPILLHEELQVTDGGRAWLSDKIIAGTMRKFSGTCSGDAFRKGLCRARVVVTNKGQLPRIYLFDVQIHSVTRESGLGDGGAKGIVQFQEQHVCNKICQLLRLPQLSAVDESDNKESEDELAS
ncbi:hypothetical protein CPB86DRAFT_823849 [Serendipita vermifera]|nr:hypothetical protein CPB86DRAFT_823849 [Serendipita vermifera]